MLNDSGEIGGVSGNVLDLTLGFESTGSKILFPKRGVEFCNVFNESHSCFTKPRFSGDNGSLTFP